MNHEAILALLAELYTTVGRLTQENAALRQQVAEATAEAPKGTDEAHP